MEAAPTAPRLLPQPLPPEIFEALPARDVARVRRADRRCVEAVASLQPRLLARRGLPVGWSLQKAHAVETALFSDALSNANAWTPGPNERSACNMLKSEDEGSAGPWLWLTGGTDWQGFQGGFRCISKDGVRPAWVTFRVRVATPALSGAFLTLSAEQRLWGLSDPVLVFGYRGDDAPPKQRRSFTLQPYVATKGVSHTCRPSRGVSCDEPHDVALHLDWTEGAMSVFVDGEPLCIRTPFKTTTIRYAAIYNWRSAARTAFSELILGDDCPYDLPGDRHLAAQPGKGHTTRCRRRLRGGRAAHGLLRQPHRLAVAVAAAASTARRRPQALAALAALGAAFAVHWAVAAGWA